jgi:hypothetical protein
LGGQIQYLVNLMDLLETGDANLKI